VIFLTLIRRTAGPGQNAQKQAGPRVLFCAKSRTERKLQKKLAIMLSVWYFSLARARETQKQALKKGKEK